MSASNVRAAGPWNKQAVEVPVPPAADPSPVPAQGFVHLVNRSQYSLLDGAMGPGELAERAAQLGMKAVGLTDTCNLYGAFEFYKAAKDAKIDPVVGSTLWISPGPLAEVQRDEAAGR